MRAKIDLDDELVARAIEMTGITDETALIRAALECLVQREAAHRLSLLGGTMPDLEVPGRRRIDDDDGED